jgi:DNA polymerase-3 subunit alpha (Gram-positive type)
MQFYDYIFISPIASINYLFETNACTPEIAKNTILRIIDVAKKINKPVAAVSGFYYLNRTSQDAHRVFIMSKLPGGRAHRFFNYGATNDHPPLLYYRNTQEMLDELNFIQDQKVLNDIVIDQTYAFMNEFEKIKINKKGLFVPNVSGAKENLEQEVYQRAKAIYGDQLDPIIAQRIKNELEIIINKGYECIY